MITAMYESLALCAGNRSHNMIGALLQAMSFLLALPDELLWALIEIVLVEEPRAYMRIFLSCSDLQRMKLSVTYTAHVTKLAASTFKANVDELAVPSMLRQRAWQFGDGMRDTNFVAGKAIKLWLQLNEDQYQQLWQLADWSWCKGSKENTRIVKMKVRYAWETVVDTWAGGDELTARLWIGIKQQNYIRQRQVGQKRSRGLPDRHWRANA